MSREHRGSCPVCSGASVERVGGEWCPRCRRWIVYFAHQGTAYWTLIPVLI